MVKVKSLRNFAFEVVYQEIKSEFDVIFLKEKRSNAPDDDDMMGSPAKVPQTEFSEGYVLSQSERGEALGDLKIKLDRKLIKPFRIERHKIVDRFIKDHSSDSCLWPTQVDLNLCLAFLKCLLDSSFSISDLTEGEGKHPFNQFNPLDLLPVISQQSPDLQSLSLVFDSTNEFFITSIPTIGPILKSFEHLTSLTLTMYQWGEGIDFLSFFTALGESCPKLILLCLGGDFNIDSKPDLLLALVLGKQLELLTPQLLDQLSTDISSLAHLQFTPQSATPICSTLQELDVYDLQPYHISFILRHFPKMQKCCSSYPGDSGNGLAVCLLHQQQQQHPNLSQRSTFQISSGELGLIVQWTVNAPFLGIFFIFHVFFITFIPLCLIKNFLTKHV